MNRFKPGDKARVIGNTSDHGFENNTEVTIQGHARHFGHDYIVDGCVVHDCDLEPIEPVQEEESPIDDLVEKRLCEMIDENAPKLMQFFLVQMGRRAVESNAETLELSCEADIEKVRYKIKTKITVNPVK